MRYLPLSLLLSGIVYLISKGIELHNLGHGSWPWIIALMTPAAVYEIMECAAFVLRYTDWTSHAGARAWIVRILLILPLAYYRVDYDVLQRSRADSVQVALRDAVEQELSALRVIERIWLGAPRLAPKARVRDAHVLRETQLEAALRELAVTNDLTPLAVALDADASKAGLALFLPLISYTRLASAEPRISRERYLSVWIDSLGGFASQVALLVLPYFFAHIVLCAMDHFHPEGPAPDKSPMNLAGERYRHEIYLVSLARSGRAADANSHVHRSSTVDSAATTCQGNHHR